MGVAGRWTAVVEYLKHIMVLWNGTESQGSDSREADIKLRERKDFLSYKAVKEAKSLGRQPVSTNK